MDLAALLAAALHDPDFRHSQQAARELAGLASADLPAALREALEDPHRKVRRAAAETLGTLGGAAAAALPALLRRTFDRERAVHAAANASVERLLPLVQGPLRSWVERLRRPGTPAE